MNLIYTLRDVPELEIKINCWLQLAPNEPKIKANTKPSQPHHQPHTICSNIYYQILIQCSSCCTTILSEIF